MASQAFDRQSEYLFIKEDAIGILFVAEFAEYLYNYI